MRITGATVLEYVRPLDGRSWNPVSRWTERRVALLAVHADNGQAGIGEAWSRQDEIGRVLDVLAERVGPEIVGASVAGPDDIGRIADFYRDAIERGADDDRDHGWPLAAATSALDIALWDLVARARAQPLWRTLGAATNAVGVYASGGLYRDGVRAGDLGDEVARYRSAGFSSVKIKIGGAAWADDLARIRSVRQTLGDEGALWVDAVNRFDAATAVQRAADAKLAGATAIQAPVAFDDLATMKRIDAVLPVVAGEAAHRHRTLADMASRAAVTLLQLNLSLAGGFSGARRVARIARDAGVLVTPQCHGTAVLQAASLHAGAAHADTHSVEFHRFHDHLHALLPASMHRVDNDIVRLGEEPGLGLSPLAEGPQSDGGTIRIHRRTGRTS